MNKLQALKFEVLITIYQNCIKPYSGLLKKFELINQILKAALANKYTIQGIGIIDLMSGEKYGFVRSGENKYMQSGDDVFVSCKKISQYCLRQGDEVRYTADAPDEGDKRMSLVVVVAINGVAINKFNAAKRRVFEELVPIYPNKHINLSKSLADLRHVDAATIRTINLFAPMGYGQRGFIIAPPKSGKTSILHSLAEVVARGDYDLEVVILLVDERPEEVTDMKQKLGDVCKIFYSDFSESQNRHVYIIDLCIEYCKRCVETGRLSADNTIVPRNIFVFCDSITRCGRAINSSSVNTGRTMSGGLEVQALQKIKKVPGCARNTNFGSLTMLSTCLVNTGSKMDDIIYEELRGTGNWDLYLSQELVNKRIYPAIDIIKSGTRKVELLLDGPVLSQVNNIRKHIVKHRSDFVEALLIKMKNIKTEAEFLAYFAMNR